MLICKICNKEFKNLNGLSKHLLTHQYNLIDYYIKFENFKIPKCIYCSKNAKLRKGIIFNKTCSSDDCLSKISKDRKHSEKSKKIISDKRINYLLNNKDKHPWKNNNKFISKPCEYFKKILSEHNIEYISEFNPIKERNFSIDIVILNKKIGIEINGNQHYNKDKTLKKYYKERKEIIEKDGWIIYDIHYSKVYDINFIEKFIHNLLQFQNQVNVDFNFNINKIKNKIFCSNCGTEITKYSKSGLCKKCVKTICIKRKCINRPTYDELYEKVNRFGYRKTGKIYNVSDTCIRNWLIKN
jgi:hypothetical protein